jgi:hypothetical protein
LQVAGSGLAGTRVQGLGWQVARSAPGHAFTLPKCFSTSSLDLAKRHPWGRSLSAAINSSVTEVSASYFFSSASITPIHHPP